MNFSSASDGIPGVPNKSRMLIKKRAAPKIFDKRLNPPSKPPVGLLKSVSECRKTDEVEGTVTKHPSGLELHDSQPTSGCQTERTVSEPPELSLPLDLNETVSGERIVDQSVDSVCKENESHVSTGALEEIASELPFSSSAVSDVTEVAAVTVSCDEKELTTSQNVIPLRIDVTDSEPVSKAAEQIFQVKTTEDNDLSKLVSKRKLSPERTKCTNARGISSCETACSENEVLISSKSDNDKLNDNSESNQDGTIEKVCENSKKRRTKTNFSKSDCGRVNDNSENNQEGTIERDCENSKNRRTKMNSLPPKKRAIRNMVARTCKRKSEDSPLFIKENEAMEKAFAHCGLRKHKKKKKVLPEKTGTTRKNNNLKMLVNDQNKEKLSLRDYIFYVPDSEPMKEELIKPEVSLNATEEQEEEDNIDEPEEIDHGPKLIIRDGEIIVDPQSTMIKRSVPQVYKDIKVERFKQRREASETWTLKDTVRFYYTLWQYGIDFSLISSSFASKSRHAVKNKFNLERRNNSCIVSKVLAKKSDDDEESFKSIMKELIVRCSKIAKKKKVKESIPSVTTSHHFDRKSKKKSATKASVNSSEDACDDKTNFFRKLVNSDSKDDDDDDDEDALIASDLDESTLNNLVNITFSTNMVYQDMNIVESVSFDPTASNPIDVNVTISHDDRRVVPPEEDATNC